MDRQRVVHFAKTRTAKVLGPVFATRPATPTSPSSELAPLASIDSDFVVITKRRDATNMAPNVWGPAPASRPHTAVTAKEIDDHVSLLEESSNCSGQREHTPPRTFLKMRSPHAATASTSSTYNSPISSSRQALQQRNHSQSTAGRCSTSFNSTQERQMAPLAKVCSPIPSEQRHSAVRGPHKPDTNHLQFARGSAAQTSPHPSSNIMQHKFSYSHTTTLPTSPHSRSGTSHLSSSETRNNLQLDRQRHTTSPCTIPHYAPKTTRMPDTRIPPTSQSSRSTTFGIHVDCAHHSEDSKNPTPLTSRLGPKTEKTPESVFSHGQVTPQQTHKRSDNKNQNISRSGSRPSLVLPEMILPFDCVRNKEEPLPEMYSISPTDYTSNLRLASERIAKIYPSHVGRSSNRQVDPLRGSNELGLSRDKDSGSVRRDTGSQEKTDTPSCNSHIPSSPFRSSGEQPQRAAPSTVSQYNSTTGQRVALSTARISQNNAKTFSSPQPRFVRTSQDLSTLEILSGNISMDNKPRFVTQLKDNNCQRRVTSSSDPATLDENTLQQLLTDSDVGGIKRLSFKLATSGLVEEWLLEKDPNKQPGHLNSATTTRAGRPAVDSSQRPGRLVLGKVPHSRVGNPTDQAKFDVLLEGDEEQLSKLKRRSFMLATGSLSDLLLLDDDTGSDSFCHTGKHFTGVHADRQFTSVQTDKQLTGVHRNVNDLRAESHTGRNSRTPDSTQTRKQLRDDSFHSCLNSSFGSFYSCASLDAGRWQQPFPKQGSDRRGRESDGSLSGETSVYYTASDRSGPTGARSSTNSPLVQNVNQRPSLPSKPSPSQTYGYSLPSRSDNHRVPPRANTLPNNRTSTTKPSKPSIHCYSCGLGERPLIEAKLQNPKTQPRVVSHRSRTRVTSDHPQESLRQNRKRSQSAPSSRTSESRVSRTPTTAQPSSQPLQRQSELRAPTYVNPSNQHSKHSLTDSDSDDCVDYSDQSTPRLPPSLGRPRRKLYAGFDSQPLPMDSFLSDSSSVYSTQSCSSRATSKSATVGSSARMSDNISRTRSVSSIASSAITPTRAMTQDDVFDLFAFTDKRSSLSENNHNFYRNSESSFTEDGLKANFYGKTYSKESLESFLSDGTSVNLELNLSSDPKPNQFKPLHKENSKDSILKRGVDKFPQNAKEKAKTEEGRLNNTSSLASSDKMKDAAHGNLNRKTNQLKSLKASSSVSLPRPSFLSRRKYFSAKDILELVMTSENFRDIKGRSKSLERQAQTMCEVILCLN